MSKDGFSPAPVFDPATGETHFLTELPVLLLEALSLSPRTAEELVHELVGSVALNQDAIEKISATLRELARAGLIESRLQ